MLHSESTVLYWLLQNRSSLWKRCGELEERVWNQSHPVSREEPKSDLQKAISQYYRPQRDKCVILYKYEYKDFTRIVI